MKKTLVQIVPLPSPSPSTLKKRYLKIYHYKGGVDRVELAMDVVQAVVDHWYGKHHVHTAQLLADLAPLENALRSVEYVLSFQMKSLRSAADDVEIPRWNQDEYHYHSLFSCKQPKLLTVGNGI